MSIIMYLVIAVVVGGGASVAAENSLPGDLLYNMKTQVNEKVMGTLATTTEAKAIFEARIAGRRLEEIERLSVRGKISGDVSAKLQENFQIYADRAEANIARLESDDAVEISSNFESSLRAHSNILAKLSLQESDDASVLASLSAKVNSETNDVVQTKVMAEGEISLDTSTELRATAEAKLKATENKIIEVRSLIETKKASLGAQATTKAEENLRIAENRLAEGKVQLEANAYGRAFVSLQQAYQEAQEAELMIDLNLQINSNLQIKTNTNTEVESTTNENTTNTSVEGEVEVKVEL